MTQLTAGALELQVQTTAQPTDGIEANIPHKNEPATEDTGLPNEYPHLSTTSIICIVAIVSCAGFLTVLNTQSILIVLPDIADSLNIPQSRQGLVVSIYNVALGSLMLFSGRLADVYGHNWVLFIGFMLFTLANTLLPFSGYEIPFYILRLIQGTGGAAMIPAGLGMISRTLAPVPVRSRSIVVVVAFASLGSVGGNLVGGFIGSFLSWKWVFWIPGIISASFTIAAYALLLRPQISGIFNQQGRLRQQKVDWLGAALISTSLILLLMTLTEANTIGWKTPWIPPLLAIACCILVAFGFWQRRLERCDGQPLVRISMFRNPRFAMLFILVGCFYASFNRFLVYATYLFQDYIGLSQTTTTLWFLPAGVSGILVSFAVSPALHKVPGFYILVTGLLCGLVPPLPFALPLDFRHTPYWAFGFPAMTLCCCVEIVWPVMSLLVAKELPLDDQALGGGLLQTSNNLGRALGLAIVTIVQTQVQGGTVTSETSNPYFLRGLQAAQWTNFAIGSVSTAIACLFFRNLGRQ